MTRAVRIFSESRFYVGRDGNTFAIDQANGWATWDHYVGELGDVELAARVGPAEGAATVPVGRMPMFPLPFYHGPVQLFSRLPKIVRSLMRATSDVHLCLFRIPGAIGLLAGVIARLRGARYAVEVVGDPVSVLRSGLAGWVGQAMAPASGLLMRWVVGGASAGRYVTERTLQELYPLRSGATGYAYSNVALAVDDFAAHHRTVTAPGRQLIAVGTQDQMYKGHDDLIRAVALLKGDLPNLRLTLVGGGRYHSALRECAEEHGVATRVRFAGRVNDRALLRRYLDDADVFVQPSLTEGLPRALVEAMARGLPAIGTRVGGIPELLPEEFLVAPGDPVGLAARIRSLGEHPRAMQAASRQNLGRAHDFSPSRQQEKVSEWLREVSARSRENS